MAISRSIIDNYRSVFDDSKSMIGNSRSIIDNYRSVFDDSKSMISNSRSIIDNNRSVFDDSKSIIDASSVMFQLVSSFAIVIYDPNLQSSYFIVEVTD